MRYWKGQAGVNCLNQSKVTQCWCEKRVYAKPNLYPPMTQNLVVVTTLEPMCQSQPCVTIHHTIDETLAGLS